MHYGAFLDKAVNLKISVKTLDGNSLSCTCIVVVVSFVSAIGEKSISVIKSNVKNYIVSQI